MQDSSTMAAQVKDPPGPRDDPMQVDTQETNTTTVTLAGSTNSSTALTSPDEEATNAMLRNVIVNHRVAGPTSDAPPPSRDRRRGRHRHRYEAPSSRTSTTSSSTESYYTSSGRSRSPSKHRPPPPPRRRTRRKQRGKRAAAVSIGQNSTTARHETYEMNKRWVAIFFAGAVHHPDFGVKALAEMFSSDVTHLEGLKMSLQTSRSRKAMNRFAARIMPRNIRSFVTGNYFLLQAGRARGAERQRRAAQMKDIRLSPRPPTLPSARQQK